MFFVLLRVNISVKDFLVQEKCYNDYAKLGLSGIKAEALDKSVKENNEKL